MPDLDPTTIQGSAFPKSFHPYPDLDYEAQVAEIRTKICEIVFDYDSLCHFFNHLKGTVS
jgi:hypothetical protein